MSHQLTSVQAPLMTRSEYTVEHRNFENWRTTLTNCVEDLRKKFAGFIKCGIPSIHFRARLFPRPFLMQPD